MIGMREIKSELKQYEQRIALDRARKRQGMRAGDELKLNTVIVGPPGTGKTSLARVLAEIYYQYGLISKKIPVEVGASDLVAGYVGQSAIKAADVLKSAVGGVLFIDEAYRLAESDFGKEAAQELLGWLTKSPPQVVVIVAGYENKMREFFGINPGLASRFQEYFKLPEYSDEELLQIVKTKLASTDYRLGPNAEKGILKAIEREKRAAAEKRDDFPNARATEQIIRRALNKQGSRLSGGGGWANASKEVLATLLYEDFL
jgi:SpoVK/Ycf46/Vps4 family AAA+-type ATPase